LRLASARALLLGLDPRGLSLLMGAVLLRESLRKKAAARGGSSPGEISRKRALGEGGAKGKDVITQ
jgi:hypothetical protein